MQRKMKDNTQNKTQNKIKQKIKYKIRSVKIKKVKIEKNHDVKTYGLTTHLKKHLIIIGILCIFTILTCIF